MRIYRFRWMENESGMNISWFTSKRAAESFQAEIGRTGDERGLDHIVGIDAIDFPTKRAEIVAWLDSNLTKDNG